MLENKLEASEHMGRYNESVRAQDMNTRMHKLEAAVRVLHACGVAIRRFIS